MTVEEELERSALHESSQPRRHLLGDMAAIMLGRNSLNGRSRSMRMSEFTAAKDCFHVFKIDGIALENTP